MEIKKLIAKNHCYIGQNNPAYVVVHETDNWAKGAGAATHAKALYNGNLAGSVHFYVDDHEIYQTLGISDGAYAVGDGGGKYGITNRNSINLEICVNPDSDYYTAVKNAKWLCAKLLKERGFGINRLKRHYDASRKNCPRRIIEEGLWNKFVEDVKNLMNGEEIKDVGSAGTGTILKKGSKGDKVKEWQHTLNVFLSGLKEDGDFGGSTEQHTIRVQKRIGADPDGIVGNQTREKADIYLAKDNWIQGTSGKWRYRLKDGTCVKSNWKQISGKWYHFDAYGWMQTGWLKDKGKWYWLKPSGEMASDELVRTGGKVYYVDKNGKMCRSDKSGALK